MNLQRLTYKDLVSRALLEDLGFGDKTTASIFLSGEKGKATILARGSGICAGLFVAREVFYQIDKDIAFTFHCQDGARITPGKTLTTLEGSISGILSGERVALNFLQRLSGIATATRKAVDCVAHTRAVITDTRKTTPGLRVLEKYAVRVGGGKNHRFDLSDMVLIKDNHIQGAGSICLAVEKIRKCWGFPVKIEVETTSLAEVQEALACQADIIMLDNMTVEEMTEAIKIIDGRAVTEASGGITQEKLQAVAESGVDYISLGCLTHSSPALDISLELTLE